MRQDNLSITIDNIMNADYNDVKVITKALKERKELLLFNYPIAERIAA